MTDCEQAYRDLMEGVEALADEWECSPGETSFHRRACPGCSRADRLRALFAPTMSENDPGYQPCNHECNGCPTCDPGLTTQASADRTARRTQPEGVERVEWGVRFSNGNVFETRTEKSAVDLASDDATYAAVHRTVTEYAPVVGPWIEVVGDE